MGNTIKMLFYCNAGHTEEKVEVTIYEGESKEEAIEREFLKWLDNNEDCGYEEI